MGLHECYLDPCPECLREELDKANSTIAELRSLLRRDDGRQETALQLITATLEALMAECKRLLTTQGEDKPDLPITVPDSPKSKAREALVAEGEEILYRNGVANPITGRVKPSKKHLYPVPKSALGYTQVELDQLIQDIADSCSSKVETKGFLTSKGFFKKNPRKSAKQSAKPAGKPQKKRASAPKKKSSTKSPKSRNTSGKPPRGPPKTTPSPRFHEYEDNHKDDHASFFTDAYHE